MLVTVQPMTESDIPAVVEIEEESAVGNCWGEDAFRSILQQRTRGRHALVAKYNGRTLGFVVYSMHGKAVFPMNVAVDIGFRRMGIGTQLIDAVKRNLRKGARNRITIMLRERSVEAQLFLKAQGFIGQPIRRAFEDEIGDEIVFSDGIEFTFRERRETNGEGPLGPLPEEWQPSASAANNSCAGR